MYPFVFAAGLITLYFLAAAFRRPRPAEILAVLLWSAYAVYEFYVANGTLCDANCNIRVDLLLFWPLLGAASWLALQAEPRTGAVVALYVVCLGVVGLLVWAFRSNPEGMTARDIPQAGEQVLPEAGKDVLPEAGKAVAPEPGKP